MHLAEKLGLTKEETMAIGDEENDRSMLKSFGNPVVMENGTDELKKSPNTFTKSNDESGVAPAIRSGFKLMYTLIKSGISAQEHDDFVKQSSQTNLLQSASWAKVKDNWDNERIGFYKNNQLVASASILIKPFATQYDHALYSAWPYYGLSRSGIAALCSDFFEKFAKTKKLFLSSLILVFLSSNQRWGRTTG